MKLLKEVLKGITPDSRRVKKDVAAFLKKLNAALKKERISANAVAGGSIEKGTFLKGDHDSDIFVKFSLAAYRDKDISKILGRILRKTFRKVTTLHGSRDYYEIKNSIRYEIVPVLDIKNPGQALNITDCSPLHARWVRKFPKYRKDIMLAKAFMKSAGVYGAESYVKGFSGHVVDILTIYYKGFDNLLKAAKNWKSRQVIDFYDYHKGKAIQNLNRSKIQSAMIIIDPIDPERNASAVLSREKLDIFRKRASLFLKKPSEEFFLKKEFSEKEILSKVSKSKGSKIIIVKATPLRRKEDVAGAKLLKAFEYICSKLKQNDFDVKDSGWNWGKAVLWFIVDRKDLPEKKIQTGPPVRSKDHAANFRKKHSKITEKDGRLYAEIRREYINAERFIKDLLKDSYIKDKVKDIKINKVI